MTGERNLPLKRGERMDAQSARLNPALFSANSEHWSTPKRLFAELNKEFHFTMDPCPLHGDSVDLGPLMNHWGGERVFVNPPYGPEISKWLSRWNEAALAVYLLPARTDTRWFHDIVLPNANEIRFIRGRLKFGDSINAAPFPSIIIVFDSARKITHTHICQGSKE